MCQRPLTLLFACTHSLDGNTLCGLDTLGRGTFTAEGMTALCEGLKGSAVTSLRCADAPKRSPFCQRPLTLNACLSPLGSVDGHALPIDELKGTKPTEKIDLSRKELSAASAIIIAPIRNYLVTQRLLLGYREPWLERQPDLNDTYVWSRTTPAERALKRVRGRARLAWDPPAALFAEDPETP